MAQDRDIQIKMNLQTNRKNFQADNILFPLIFLYITCGVGFQYDIRIFVFKVVVRDTSALDFQAYRDILSKQYWKDAGHSIVGREY